jgi:predicted nuclease of restriction endonuclease-like (RecB) superfamily
MKFELLVDSIAHTHSHFQQQACKAINVSLTLRNWLIGYYIIEFEQNGEDRAVYGTGLLNKLAIQLNIKGLVSAELSRCRQFYRCYPQILGSLTQEFKNLIPSSILGSLTQELQEENIAVPIRGILTTEPENKFQLKGSVIVNMLSFTHLVELIKIDNHLKRTYYELECIKGTWSVRELKRQINTLYYERSGMSVKPELLREKVQQNAEIKNPTDIVKSVYAFEFLGLKTQDAVEESDLETALLDHLKDFMMEMGDGFCLEARQKRILIDDEYFFADLVFYHRILKCHVIIELKVDAFKHEHLSQLNTYVAYYNAEVKRDDDNPAIGILLCTQKGKKLVEYATAGMDNALFVSKYLLELPKKEQLEAFILKELNLWK